MQPATQSMEKEHHELPFVPFVILQNRENQVDLTNSNYDRAATVVTFLVSSL